MRTKVNEIVSRTKLGCSALRYFGPIGLALLLLPSIAHAQASPFDTGFTALETLFTGTVAKVASLIAIVIGGYGFAHGEPGHKKALAASRGHRHRRTCHERPHLALGRIANNFQIDH